jgi:hypothetical protein
MIDENINASLKVAQFPSSARTWAMTAQSRWQICEWYYQSKYLQSPLDSVYFWDSYITIFLMYFIVTESYNFSPEIAMISMNYLDRILSICENVPDSKDDVQLLALTCFYLAVKLFQSGPVLSTSHMAQISGGCYTAKQISNMEQKVLFILEWRLHSPCATDFFRQFYGVILRNLGSCLPIDIRQRVSEMACTVIQASILDYFFVANPIRPSHLAAASLLLSLKIFLPHSANIQDIFHRLNQLTGNRLDFDHVALCCRRLSFIVYDHAQLKTSSLVFYTSTTLSCLEQTMPMVSPYVYKPRGV